MNSSSSLPPLLPPPTASPRGLLPNPLALLHRNPSQPKKPFSPDKTIAKAAIIGLGVGSVAAAGYTTQGAFLAKASETVAKTALAKLSGIEKTLAIGVSFLFGGALGSIASVAGTFLWRGIIHQCKPPADS